MRLLEDPICNEVIVFANGFFERPQDILLDTSTFLPWQQGDPFTEKLQQEENETDEERRKRQGKNMQNMRKAREKASELKRLTSFRETV